MTLVATSTFNVTDQAPTTVAATAPVLPPVSYGAGGRGRLVHPTLGAYDYANTPDETVNLDGDICVPPIWSHTQTLGGGVDALWPSYPRDCEVIERWLQGDVGCPINHLRQLWQFFVNPPDPVTGSPIIWAPNYASPRTYKVFLVGLTAGGEQYKLNTRLARYGYAPTPVELKLRIFAYAS